MPNSVCKIKHFNVITSWNTNVLNFRQKAYERIPLRETKNPIYTQTQGTPLNVLALAEQSTLVHVPGQCYMKLFMESVTHPKQILHKSYYTAPSSPAPCCLIPIPKLGLGNVSGGV